MAITTVIVGAGSGGGALAARLTEDPNQQVILVESGPDFATLDEVPAELRDPSQMSVENFDWKYKAYFMEPPATREPQMYPRGRVVGGSSCVNAAIAVRGTKDDFDTWVAAGCDEWSYEETLPYYQRLENDLDFPDSEFHGNSGPIPITRYPREEWSTGAQAFVTSCLERGYPPCDDANHLVGTGVGAMPRNIVGEDRASSLLTYIAEARKRPNFTLIPDAHCLRVVFEGTRAVGVEIDGAEGKRVIRADRTVLAAGAIATPQILILSGVGPVETLDQLGIDHVVASEGVGRNFQDHPFTPVMTLLKEDTDKEGVRVFLKFSTKTGGLVDDIQMPASVLDPATLNLDVDTKGKKALTLVSILAKPRSVGWLTVKSTDPLVPPEIHANFFSDPSDMERLMESVRLAYDIATSSPVKDEISEILFPDAETVSDDDKLEEFIRNFSSTAYHSVGTCRMGPDGDPGAVVDQHLAVRGAQDLWISDGSVMVNVPTALTNLTCYMIGERLADWLKPESASS